MLNENLSKDIHTAVRKVAKQMENQSNNRKQPIKNRIAQQSFEGEMCSVNNSESMVTLEGNNNASNMETILTKTPHGSTAVIEKNYQRSSQIQSIPEDPQEIGMTDWMNIIKTKANKEDVERLQEIKANKQDIEQQMKAVDIMHRQITHLSILLTEVQKSIINEQNETAAAVKSKRMFALEQIVNVTNWIHDFNPQNVNFMDLNLPKNLRTLDDYSHVAVRDYPKQNRMVDISKD